MGRDCPPTSRDGSICPRPSTSLIGLAFQVVDARGKHAQDTSPRIAEKTWGRLAAAPDWPFPGRLASLRRRQLLRLGGSFGRRGRKRSLLGGRLGGGLLFALFQDERVAFASNLTQGIHHGAGSGRD